MRYFKYWNSNKTEQIAKKAQYAELTAHEKKLVRRGKVFGAIAKILFFADTESLYIDWKCWLK